MHPSVLLTALLALSCCALNIQAKPITQQMHSCNSSSNSIRTISTDCKKPAAGFSLGYSLENYGDHGALLRIENSTARNIEIDRIELLDAWNQPCELDSWGPEGETVSAQSYFNVMSSECRPERIFKYVFIQGNKRYVF
ncbi:hypothetical protein [Acinetobacter pragensis]|uniref:Spore coat protein U domain-containing protein n=1 Tax=Acinetobacter pragensis TaxID=1806892 RepID=A0A151Y0C6_9GAMM|nr:hypothetical protein [Acinetobacter pragensis]KYQ71490.1 hypothetical protein AZH43_14160 [Acinetobacter pragensis]